MAVLDDAIELVCWFEDQPNCATYKSDAAIGIALGWFVGGRQFIHMNSARDRARGGFGPGGDQHRVRKARSYVDKHNDCQPFLGYAFGTKRNGAGVKFMMLISPNGTSVEETWDKSTGEQMGRAVQQTTQASAERARMVHKLNELEAEYIRAGSFDKALIVHDAARELQTFGQLSMTTLQGARSLGILSQVGAAS